MLQTRTTFNPSTAEVTVTAGVKAPSDNKVAPPITAGTINQGVIFLTRVYKEKYHLRGDYPPLKLQAHT